MRDPSAERLLGPVGAAIAGGLGAEAATALAEGAALDVPAALALARTVLAPVAADADGSPLGSTVDSPDGPARP